MRTENQSGRSTLQSKISSLEERIESMQGDLTLLAQARVVPEWREARVVSMYAGTVVVAGAGGRARSTQLILKAPGPTCSPLAHLCLTRP